MLSFYVHNAIMNIMKNIIKTLKSSGLDCQLYLPGDYETCLKYYPVIYVNGEIPIEDVLSEVEKQGGGVASNFLMLSVKPNSWNDDFTPWSAVAFRPGEMAPSGNADAYIKILSEEIKPFIDENFRTRKEPENATLIGYSLGGLTTLYSIYKTDVFGKIGSISGSLWYDNRITFMGNTIPERKTCKVYLSLGRKESKSRNSRMARVGDCTERAEEILKSSFGEKQVFFEWNEGGHFTDVSKRLAKAIVGLVNENLT